MFTTITYTAAIASLIGSMCFSHPVLEATPSIELVYKIDATTKKEYYKPVYIIEEGSSTTSDSSTFKPVLLTDVYQIN